MPLDLAHCKRALGGDIRECLCKLPQEAGWAECPQAARGLIGRKSEPRPEYLAAPRSVLAGDICQDCGSPQMIRTGTCMTCLACGSSNGGCS